MEAISLFKDIMNSVKSFYTCWLLFAVVKLPQTVSKFKRTFQNYSDNAVFLSVMVINHLFLTPSSKT